MADAVGLGFDHQVGDLGRQAGQRVDLQDVGLEVVVDVQAEVHPGHIQRSGYTEDGRGVPVQVVHHLRFQWGGSQVGQLVGQVHLQAVAVDRVRFLVRLQVHFHRRQEAQPGLDHRRAFVDRDTP